MRSFALAVLLIASPLGAQTIGDDAPYPTTIDDSYGSFALGWRDGSAMPSYTLDTSSAVDAGTLIASLRLGTDNWNVAAESSMSWDGLVDRHGLAVRQRLSHGATPLELGVSYGYQSIALPILTYEDLEVLSRRQVHAALVSLRAYRSFGTVTIFGGPTGGAAYVQDSFDTYLGSERTASRKNAVLSGTSGIFGFDAGIRWQWRGITLDGTVMPLWVPEKTSAIIENDFICSVGISYQTPWRVGFGARAIRSTTDRGITHLGSTVTAAITVVLP